MADRFPLQINLPLTLMVANLKTRPLIYLNKNVLFLVDETVIHSLRGCL